MKRNQEKEKHFPLKLILLTSACTAFILVIVFLWLNSMQQKGSGNENRYITEIDGYDMADLSIYGNLRVYDLLDANGFTDYEGSGYNRS